MGNTVETASDETLSAKAPMAWATPAQKKLHHLAAMFTTAVTYLKNPAAWCVGGPKVYIESAKSYEARNYLEKAVKPGNPDAKDDFRKAQLAMEESIAIKKIKESGKPGSVFEIALNVSDEEANAALGVSPEWYEEFKTNQHSFKPC